MGNPVARGSNAARVPEAKTHEFLRLPVPRRFCTLLAMQARTIAQESVGHFLQRASLEVPL